MPLAAVSFFVVVGCAAPVEKVAPNGRFAQLYLNNQPVVEFDYSDAASCATQLNTLMAVDPATRKAASQGLLRLECSASSRRDVLKYEFKTLSVLTGQEYPSRAVSYESCRLLTKNTENSGYKYNC